MRLVPIGKPLIAPIYDESDFHRMLLCKGGIGSFSYNMIGFEKELKNINVPDNVKVLYTQHTVRLITFVGENPVSFVTFFNEPKEKKSVLISMYTICSERRKHHVLKMIELAKSIIGSNFSYFSSRHLSKLGALTLSIPLDSN